MSHHRIAVVRASAVYEGLQLEDGAVLAVELAQPQTRYALVHQNVAGALEILSTHAGESEAVRAYEELVARLEEMEQLAAAPAGAVLQ
jgi:hypothetical protein